jgi:pantoate--beta-alanine ligase
MRLLTTVNEVKDYINRHKKEGKTIGFVPTMGALHMGHISLIEIAKRQNSIVLCSIFVNPIQFNNASDLERYPRTLQKDTELIEKYGCDAVFAPSDKEIYPEKDMSQWDFGLLDKVMEAEHRPGHFNGVAIVVKRLLEIVEPHKAYFGEKDYQQVMIIRQLVNRLKMPVEIIACPIIREEDGLAMSSRNMLLNLDERQQAANISKALFEAKANALKMSVKELKGEVVKTINKNDLLKVEYFEVADAETLKPVDEWIKGKKIMGFVAVQVGKIRLIDNVVLV